MEQVHKAETTARPLGWLMQGDAPDQRAYGSLSTLQIVLRAMGVWTLVTGLIGVFVAGVAAVAEQSWLMAAVAFGGLVQATLLCVVCFGAATVVEAVHDTARNSWILRRAVYEAGAARTSTIEP